MSYELPNGKKVKIPLEEIKKSMKLLDISEDEAIQMYLEDEGYLDNVEQLELCEKAKENKVTKLIQVDSMEKKKPRERIKKENPDKKYIIDTLFDTLISMLEIDIKDIKIVNNTKLIEFSYKNKDFKLDLIEKRAKKSEK